MTIQWDYGEALLPNDDSNALEFSQGWYGKAPSFSDLKNQSLTVKFHADIGLQGIIWVSKKPEWIEDISQEKGLFILSPKLASAGLKSALGVPTLLKGQVLLIFQAGGSVLIKG